jgi:triacylglycerol lipase
MNIVLVHGILGFRKKLGIEYFNGVQERLQARFGAHILVPDLGQTTSIVTCGEELRSQMLAAFNDGRLDPDAPTHIIGHSQGGLDARYMLSPANPHTAPGNDVSGKVASLTTIGSPHEGSPVADLLLLAPVDHALQHLRALQDHPLLASHLIEAGLDFLGIDGNALSDLDTAKMRRFNEQFPDHPAVRYFAVAGAGRPHFPGSSRFLFGFRLYIKSKTGEANDGLVSLSSALRWKNDSETWPTDHADEIGHNLDSLELKPSPDFDYLAGYERIVKRALKL